MRIETEFVVPLLDRFRNIAPVHRLVEHVGEVIADGRRAAAKVDVTFQLRQPELLVGHVLDRPFGLGRELNEALHVQTEGNGESGVICLKRRHKPGGLMSCL